jgi:hypothetical protein
MFRLVVLPLLAAVTLGLAAPAASAAAATKLDSNLAALWTKILETPSAQNPFGTGGPATECWKLGGKVAPEGPGAVPQCIVQPGTTIFEAASSFECSTFPGDTNPTSPTEAALRACAKQNDAQTAPSVTVDGRPLPLTEVETELLYIVLPADNIFGQPAGTTGLSVAHGWVALVNPLTAGTHTIVATGSVTFTTTIIVRAS